MSERHRRSTSAKLTGLLAALTLSVAAFTASGHHSTAMFDADNPIELAGTVVKWQFDNPHCFITLEVTDEQGGVEVWSLEGMSPNVLYRQGWRPDSLRPGDRIVATVNPLHSGAPGGNYRNLRWTDGTAVDPRAGRPE
jgi:hypothetical protein